MLANQSDWTQAKEKMVAAMKKLGFREELGEAIAKNLGSPKAMLRRARTASASSSRTAHGSGPDDSIPAECQTPERARFCSRFRV